MDWSSIIVAAISALGAFLGVYYANKRSASLIEYRIGQLEAKVDRHNSVIDRTYHLEEQAAVLEEKIKVANNRIADLEKRGA